jgi:hypothetical protein
MNSNKYFAFNLIPKDIIEIIIRFLKEKELYALSKVSRNFNIFVKRSKVWSEIELPIDKFKSLGDKKYKIDRTNDSFINLFETKSDEFYEYQRFHSIKFIMVRKSVSIFEIFKKTKFIATLFDLTRKIYGGNTINEQILNTFIQNIIKYDLGKDKILENNGLLNWTIIDLRQDEAIIIKILYSSSYNVIIKKNSIEIIEKNDVIGRFHDGNLLTLKDPFHLMKLLFDTNHGMVSLLVSILIFTLLPILQF